MRVRSRLLARIASLPVLLGACAASAQTVVLTWGGAVSGQWTTAANWSPATVPNNVSTLDAVISPTGAGTPYTVTASGAASLSVRKLDLTAANATLVFNFSSASPSLSLGSAISNLGAGVLDYQQGSGIFGQATTATTLNVAAGAELRFSAAGTRSVAGLTLANSGTVHATSGTTALGSGGALTLSNASGGLIYADGAEITFFNVALANAGTLRANGSAGILRFNNTVTTAALGTVDLVNGGHAILSGTLTNTGDTLMKPGAGSYELTGGNIVGGTIANGALTLTTGGKLDAAVWNDNVTLPAGGSVTLTNGASFTGNATFGTNSTLYWQQAGMFAGKTLNFSGTNGEIYLYNPGNNAPATLVLDAASTGSGQVKIYSDSGNGSAFTNQGTLTHTSGSYGQIYARSVTNSGTIANTSSNGSLQIGSTTAGYSVTNTGTITVNGGTGAIVYLNGDVANAGGTINATAGQVIFGGATTNGNLNGGTLNITGGHAYLNGTVTNSGTLNAPTQGNYELYGGTIAGGTIAANALTFTNSGGKLDAASLTGNLTLPASSTVTFANGAGFTGSAGTFNANSTLYWQQTGTLAGKALSFTGQGEIYLYNPSNNAPATLTLDAASTGTGQLRIYADGGNGSVLTNQGNFTHTSTSYGQMFARTFTNSGTIANTSASGTLQLGSTTAGYSASNSGTITVNGGASTVINLDGPFANTGTLNATNGQLIFHGATTNSNLNGGTVNIGAGGHAYLSGTVANNGTVNAPAAGQWELSNGTIAGGSIAANALTFTGSGGKLDGVTYTGALTLPASSNVTFVNGSSFTGGAATLNANSTLYWQQAGMLAGKALTFTGNGEIYLYNPNNNAPATLTLDAAATGTGQLKLYSDTSNGSALTNQGSLTQTSANYGQLYARTFSNTGTIANTSAGGTLQLGSTSAGYAASNSGTITVNGGASTIINLDGPFANTGTLNATNGQLVFRGTTTDGNLNGGTVNIGANGHAFLSGTVANGGTLNAPAAGQWELASGTITGGGIAANALTFTGSGGKLDTVAYTGALTLPASTNVTFTNGSSFSGGTGTFNANSTLYWQQGGTLAGKALTFAGNGEIYLYNPSNTSPATLTLDAASTAAGQLRIYSDGGNGSVLTNQGNLTHTSANYGQLYARTFANSGSIANTTASSQLQLGSTTAGYVTTNTGTITVNAANATIYLDGAFGGAGALNAPNGQLVFRGTNTEANLNASTLNIGASGHAYLNGTLNNGGTLNAPATGAYELYGGTINGGTVAANALSFTGNGGKLDAVTVSGGIAVPASANVTFTNGSLFTGASASIGSNATLYWQQSGTLAGKTLTFGANGELYLYNPSNTAPATLTLDAATTASGQLRLYSDGSNGSALTNRGALTHNSANYGQMYARTFTNSGTIANTATNGQLQLGTTTAGYATTNTGTITVNGANATTYLDGNFANNGTLNATNGQLTFRGNTTNGNLNGGTVNIAASGHAFLTGTVTNTGTLNAPAQGSYELSNGTINGGTIAAAALTFTANGGLLDGVSLLDPLITLPANATVTFNNGTTFATGATFGNNASITWNQSGTLGGKALTFGSNSRLYLNAANASLTLGPTTTATGTLGIYSDSSSSGTSIANQAALTNTTGTGTLYAKTFTNTGTITATGGSLNLGTTTTGYSFANSAGGTLAVNGAGAAIQLFTPAATQLFNDGAINVATGTLFTSGRLTNNTGTITGTGTINGGLTMAGGIIAPGNNGIGTLNFSGGTLTVTGTSSYAVELGGASADKLAFTSPTSMINIGSGLLTLSLTLTAPPVNLSNYDLISTNTGSIVGSFAGLPNSGDIFAATFNSTPYLFAVNYSATLVSIQAVPEPSTYALLGLGLAALAALRRRKR